MIKFSGGMLLENLENYLKKIGEEGWYNIANSLLYVRCPDKMELLRKTGFDVDGRNDGFIALCYVNHLEGLSFYVIAAAHLRFENIFISKENKSASLSFTAATLKDCLYLNQNYMNIDFSRWKPYVDSIKSTYEADCEEAVEIRKMSELDDFRIKDFPDNIEVLLIGKGFDQERIIVRAETFGENCFNGILLTEPDQPFGIHKGDEISFMLVDRNGSLGTVSIVK